MFLWLSFKFGLMFFILHSIKLFSYFPNSIPPPPSFCDLFLRIKGGAGVSLSNCITFIMSLSCGLLLAVLLINLLECGSDKLYVFIMNELQYPLL